MADYGKRSVSGVLTSNETTPRVLREPLRRVPAIVAQIQVTQNTHRAAKNGPAAKRKADQRP